MHADEHAGAMYMTMTMMRPCLFFQREGPGSEPGNSLLCPDEASCSSVCGVLGIVQCRAIRRAKPRKQRKPDHGCVGTVRARRANSVNSVNRTPTPAAGEPAACALAPRSESRAGGTSEPAGVSRPASWDFTSNGGHTCTLYVLRVEYGLRPAVCCAFNCLRRSGGAVLM